MGRQGGFSNNNNCSQSWRNNQNQNFGWNQDSGPSNNQGPFQQQQQQPLYPSVTERLNKFEDILEKFLKATTMASEENNMAVIKNREIQMGQIAKQLAERQSRQLLANAQTNPREHYSKVAYESGKIA